LTTRRGDGALQVLPVKKKKKANTLVPPCTRLLYVKKMFFFSNKNYQIKTNTMIHPTSTLHTHLQRHPLGYPHAYWSKVWKREVSLACAMQCMVCLSTSVFLLHFCFTPLYPLTNHHYLSSSPQHAPFLPFLPSLISLFTMSHAGQRRDRTAVSEQKLKKLLENNQRLRYQLEMPRIPVSEASIS
jgi:hypothetical protein